MKLSKKKVNLRYESIHLVKNYFFHETVVVLVSARYKRAQALEQKGHPFRDALKTG